MKKEKHLKLAIHRLKKWIGFNEEDLLNYYKDEDTCDFEEIDGFYYTLFTFPALDKSGIKAEKLDKEIILLNWVVLLVFDQKDQIIADIAALSSTMDDFMKNKALFDYLCDESDWCYLSHYTLVNSYFDDLDYPLCEKENNKEQFEGECLLYTNAYVTKAYRKRKIFTNMINMTRDFICKKTTTLYRVFSMDPDVACYGPDTSKEPYIYSFEKDEPDRLRNKEIAIHLGFEPLRLIDDEEDENSDGTKLWYCIKKENILVVEEDYIN